MSPTKKSKIVECPSCGGMLQEYRGTNVCVGYRIRRAFEVEYSILRGCGYEKNQIVATRRPE